MPAGKNWKSGVILLGKPEGHSLNASGGSCTQIVQIAMTYLANLIGYANDPGVCGDHRHLSQVRGPVETEQSHVLVRQERFDRTLPPVDSNKAPGQHIPQALQRCDYPGQNDLWNDRNRYQGDCHLFGSGQGGDQQPQLRCFHQSALSREM